VILVAGGTGRLGSLVVRRLADRGAAVRVLTRSRENASHLPGGVDVVTGDVRDPSSVAAAMCDVDVAVSAVHGFVGPQGVSPATVDRDGNANLVAAAAGVGADLVMMSVVGASPSSSMELFRMKHAAEQHARSSGVPTTIVRATAFMELWIELLRQTASRSGRPLVFGRGDNPINFVSVTDVAATVDLAIADRSTRGTVLEIGGPDNVTFNELARAVQAADGGDRGPRHVPPVMLRVLASTVGRVKPQIGRQTRAALAMDRDNLSFDDDAIRERHPELPCTSLVEVLDGAHT
jgi:NADH dehydrogenase